MMMTVRIRWQKTLGVISTKPLAPAKMAGLRRRVTTLLPCKDVPRFLDFIIAGDESGRIM